MKKIIDEMAQLDDRTIWYMAIHSPKKNLIGVMARKICINRGISRFCKYSKNQKQLKEEWELK